MILRLLLIALTLTLSGCDFINTLMTDPKIAQREADARAIGGACRYGLRNIEDCYALNPKSSKAAVFAGWKDMDQYMRDNKIDGVASQGIKAQPNEEIVDEPKAADKAAPPDKAKAKP